MEAVLSNSQLRIISYTELFVNFDRFLFPLKFNSFGLH